MFWRIRESLDFDEKREDRFTATSAIHKLSLRLILLQTLGKLKVESLPSKSQVLH